MATIKTKTIKLEHPVSVDGKETAALAMRDSHKVRERLAATKLARDAYGQQIGAAEVEICLFAVLCGVGVEVIEDLDDEDYGRMLEAYQDRDFPSPRPGSGDSSSTSDATRAGD